MALLWLLAWTLPAGVAAQAQAAVRLAPPLSDHFPSMSAFVAVSDPAGRRIPGLPASSFTLTEDQKPVPVLSVQDSQLGTRQIVVLDTGSGLRVRDRGGRSRLDAVRDALLAWWSRPEMGTIGVNDLSLITTEGPLASHLSSAAALASALDAFQPAYDLKASGFDLLLKALDFAADPLPRPGMRTYVVYFTALIDTPRDLPVANLITRAQQADATILAVVVAPPEAVQSQQALNLQQAARATGGDLSLFDARQGLSALADLIEAQGTQYQVNYTSAAASSGQHSLQVRVSAEGLEAVSEPRSFSLNVLPPEVALVDPPQSLIRRSSDPSLRVDQLPPTSRTLQLLITFPDGHPRPIANTELIIDGRKAAEDTQPPFDTLEWDLSGFTATKSHSLQVSVLDSLGLQALSEVHAVRVEVVSPPRGLAALRPAFLPLLAALTVLILGVGLAVTLGSASRRPAAPPGTTARPAVPRRSLLRPSLVRRDQPAQPPEAYLVPLDPTLAPLPLTGLDLLLGRDASLAGVVLDDLSVGGMHARLVRLAEGSYLLRDQGSVAGTWVNYEPVPEEGRRLSHGDLIHLGRVGFRFVHATAPPPRSVRISPPPDGEPSIEPASGSPDRHE